MIHLIHEKCFLWSDGVHFEVWYFDDKKNEVCRVVTKVKNFETKD